MISPAEKQSFISDHKAGLTPRELSQKYHIGYSATKCRLKAYGLATPRKPHTADHTRLDELINQGASNEEIKAILGPIHKSMLAHRRQVLGKQTFRIGAHRAKDEDADPYTKPVHLKRWEGPCPKCGGATRLGGAWFGSYMKELQSCLICGLSNESESYFDAHKGMRVEI